MTEKMNSSSISNQVIEEIENQIQEGIKKDEFKKKIHQIINNKVLEWLKWKEKLYLKILGI